ncbi:hypothetical protein ACLOJK_028040, partial [Asimina triloba]
QATIIDWAVNLRHAFQINGGRSRPGISVRPSSSSTATHLAKQEANTDPTMANLNGVFISLPNQPLDGCSSLTYTIIARNPSPPIIFPKSEAAAPFQSHVRPRSSRAWPT